MAPISGARHDGSELLTRLPTGNEAPVKIGGNEFAPFASFCVMHKVRAKTMSLADLPVALDTEPMEARLVDRLPDGPDWQFEPKWDGFRCLAFRAGDEVDLRAKSGKPLARYFPDVVAELAALAPRQFVLDGELAIPVGETLSFDALQMRLHPAESRVTRLAAETPAIFILFDCLMSPDGNGLLDEPLSVRRTALEGFYAGCGEGTALRLSPFTRQLQEAQGWLERAGGALDGVIGKRIDGSYRSGERDMIKVKFLRSADCVVGGFRYGRNGREVGSLLLGLYNEAGKLDHVGFTSAISDADRPALTEKLEALAGPPGFTGKAPGGPSRWSSGRSAEWQPVRPELVVEVRYDHVTGGRFRHGVMLMRWRPDKAPRQCTMDQLHQEARPGALFARVMKG
jgi:ATP-dependent DNA ligase